MSLPRQWCERSNRKVSRLQITSPAEAGQDNNSLCHYLILGGLQSLTFRRWEGEALGVRMSGNRNGEGTGDQRGGRGLPTEVR